VTLDDLPLLSPDGSLATHARRCFCCGPRHDTGLHLTLRRDGEEVVAEHVFAAAFQGAPGMVHGGIVATALDDLMCGLMDLAGVIGVTRHLEVDYLAPVQVELPYVLRARLDRREGRKFFCSATGAGPDGSPAFTGSGLFLEVPLEHFGRG
jgi:acyl-coenzyme A thioesterase PaaI-like protein